MTRRWTLRRQLLVGLGVVVAIAALNSGGADPTPLASETTVATEAPSASSISRTPTSTTVTSTPAINETPTTLADYPGIPGLPRPGPSGDPNSPPPAGAEPAIVVAITDGDTIRVDLAGGPTESLRLIGINSPESDECHAVESAAVLDGLIPPGTEVHLTRDVSDRDRFGRLLRYVWLGGFHVNEELVRRGAAIAREYPPDVAMSDRLRSAQEAAEAAGVGLWAPDACGPSSGLDVEIIELQADAPGNDHENLNGEWVRIRNRGDIGVDLTGWVLKDESATHRYEFPDGYTLAAGAGVTIFTGCGADRADELYWCSSQGAVWNNDGDTAFLLDHNGNVVSTLSSR